MKPSPFTYHRPSTVSEAVALLTELGDGAKVLAGGQSLVPLMSMRLAAPAHLVDINHIPGLDVLEVNADHVRIGALARHSRIEKDEVAFAAIPLLRQAVQLVAHPTIRNRGTTVGSLVHGDPSAEMSAVLLLLDGVMELESADGPRVVPAADFFVGPMETSVRTGELAVAARFIRPRAGTGSAFVEMSRRHGDYAVCGVGALVSTDGDGAITSAKVALISVGAGPVPVDVTSAITGSGGGFGPAVHELVDAQIDPEGDIHASAEYRRHLSHILTSRVLGQAHQHAVASRRDDRVA